MSTQPNSIPSPNMFLAHRADESPVQIENLFKSDAEYIFIVGQNLHWIATTESAKEALLAFLHNPNHKLDLLICDPHFYAGVKAWTRVNPTTREYNYEQHLRVSVEELDQLRTRADTDRFRLRVADLLPFGGYFVNPEDKDSAFMVLTPVVNGGPDGSERPQFIVERRCNETAFLYYWSRLRNVFREEGLSRNLSARGTILVSHGHSAFWKDLKDFLVERLGLTYEEFNHHSAAGVTTPDRLTQMLENSCFAFIVMTAEDEQHDTAMRARQNVVHEAGLAQATYGFSRAIVLLEEGCEEFSNIQGLGQIRFPEGNITASFEEVRRVLEREGIIPARK